MKNRNFYPAQYYRRAGILAPVKNVRMVSIRVQSRRHQRALWAKVNAMRQQTVSVETEGAFFAATIIEGARANAKRVKVWFRRDVVAMLPQHALSPSWMAIDRDSLSTRVLSHLALPQ